LRKQCDEAVLDDPGSIRIFGLPDIPKTTVQSFSSPSIPIRFTKEIIADIWHLNCSSSK